MENQVKTGYMADVVKEFDLFEFIRYALRRFGVIAAVTIACGLLAAVYAFVLATPIYEATAQLYVVNPQDSMINLSDIQIGSYLTEDYQLVFDTWEVNQMVIENLSLSCSVEDLRDMVEVTKPGNSRVLYVTVASKDPAQAALIANEMADVARRYIADVMLTETPTLLSSALVPIKPVKPQKALIVLLGLLVGAALTIWGLLIAYSRDDKIKTSADIVKYTGAMPLSVVPLSAKKQAKRTRGR